MMNNVYVAIVGLALAWFPCRLIAQTAVPPEIAARSYFLVDVTANQILAAKEIDTPLEPASLTKLMTAYLVFEALQNKKIDLKQTLPVSERAWKMPGSRMFIDPKMQVPVEDLIRGMIVQSGNDATMALAEGVGGTAEQFVHMMNDQARILGLKATVYKNPEGLTVPGHTTTARDLAQLSMRLMADFPQYVGIYAIKKYRYPGTPAANDSNRNLLLFRDPNVDGLKTGHTDAAGYCMVATAKRDFVNLRTVENANQAGSRRLLSVVLGAESENSRANESQKLLNWGFTAFDAIKLFDPGQTVASPRIWKGVETMVRIGSPSGIFVAVPAGMASKLAVQVVRKDPLVAPIANGQQLAVLRVNGIKPEAVDIPLVALEAVEQSGVFGRAWDAVRLWVQ